MSSSATTAIFVLYLITCGLWGFVCGSRDWPNSLKILVCVTGQSVITGFYLVARQG